MEGPAVHYNIGVAAYRLQRYDRARMAFEQVAKVPSMAGIAHYNLGLVAQAEGRERNASEFFARAAEETEDERLRSLARAQLEALGTTSEAAGPAWVAYGATGLGYDDNVALTSDGQALGLARRDDVYMDTVFVGSILLPEAWRIDADASALKYADLTELDQWDLGVGGRYRFTLQAWALDLGTRVGTTYLDARRLDTRESVYVQGLHSFSAQRSFRTRYRLSHVQGGDDYPGLDGLRHELLARLLLSARSFTYGLAYSFELGDFEAASLSATCHQLLGDVRAPLSPRWVTRASLAYRHSDYDDATLGSEDRFEFTAAAEFLLKDQWTLALQYLFTDNDAAVREFAYRRNRFFFGIETTF